jgi:hypothetical protein
MVQTFLGWCTEHPALVFAGLGLIAYLFSQGGDGGVGDFDNGGDGGGD